MVLATSWCRFASCPMGPRRVATRT